MAKRTSSRRARPTRRPAKHRSAKPKKAARPTAKARGRAKPKTKPKKAAAPKRPRKAVKAVTAKRQVVAKAPARQAKPAAAPRAKAPKAQAHELHPPTLSRARRQLSDDERATAPGPDSRLVAEAKSGHEAVAKELREHTSTSPALTAGDVDANWEEADSEGDEAPGGDNPTPDQNEVDAIGRALGTEYEDDEELMGGDEIGERDEHRWELDPDSREDAGDED